MYAYMQYETCYVLKTSLHIENIRIWNSVVKLIGLSYKSMCHLSRDHFGSHFAVALLDAARSPDITHTFCRYDITLCTFTLQQNLICHILYGERCFCYSALPTGGHVEAISHVDEPLVRVDHSITHSTNWWYEEVISHVLECSRTFPP